MDLLTCDNDVVAHSNYEGINYFWFSFFSYLNTFLSCPKVSIAYITSIWYVTYYHVKYVPNWKIKQLYKILIYFYINFSYVGP